MDLDLGLAASFLVLVEERHYGHAAARLHLTQSALSKRMQRLERQLGVTLVERPPSGGFRVTASGLRFAEAAGPLLVHAVAVRRSAIDTPRDCQLRIGYPAGTGAFLARIGISSIADALRRDFPDTRLTCREVPFPALNSCLPEHQVDVLWTTAAVRHAAVDSFPLRMTSGLIGVVGHQHPLARAISLSVSDFCEQPMFFNSSIPAEWMDPFLLTDVRGRREARLVHVDARDHPTVLRTTANGQAVIATLSMVSAGLGQKLSALNLLGAPRVGFHAARRHVDRRAAVAALIDHLQVVAADCFP